MMEFDVEMFPIIHDLYNRNVQFYFLRCAKESILFVD